MAKCPSCEEDVDVPEGESLRLDEMFTEEVEDVDVSIQQHIQLTCPECDAVLGYLGVAGAAGG